MAPLYNKTMIHQLSQRNQIVKASLEHDKRGQNHWIYIVSQESSRPISYKIKKKLGQDNSSSDMKNKLFMSPNVVTVKVLKQEISGLARIRQTQAQ